MTLSPDESDELDNLKQGWATAYQAQIPPKWRQPFRIPPEYPYPIYPYKGSYIWGPVGTGKSYLAAALCHQLAPGRKLIWWNLTDLIERIRASFDNASLNPLMTAKDTDILVLDDIGAENPTDFVRERIYSIINHRIERTDGITIVTGNLSLSDLDGRLGARIASRLGGLKDVVQLTGEDRRLSE